MEKEITFLLDGVECGKSFLTIEDGKMYTDAAEEEFYKVLRRNSKDLEEEEKEYLLDNLSKEQEEKLGAAHMKDYHGDKDHWEDSFERFLEDISLAELKKII